MRALNSVKLVFVLLPMMVLASLPAAAMVQLPALFSDNMVLQRETHIPLWGTADAGEKITIHAGKKVITTRAAADGRWHVLLPSMRATTMPFDITITAGNTLSLHNVLVGDVFLCAGQSNMQKPIGPWPGQQPVNNYEQEIAQADYPTIRLFNVAEAQALAPQERCQGQWVVCSPQTAGSFSAAAYFFARQLVQENHVPIGLITASVGGTYAQVWTSIDSLKRTTHFRGVAERGEELSAFANTTALLEGRQISDVANKFKQQWWVTHDPGFTPGHTWTSLDYDDSGWQTTTIPSNLWQYVGFADFEGMIWYRRTVQVPDDWQGKNLLFS